MNNEGQQDQKAFALAPFSMAAAVEPHSPRPLWHPPPQPASPGICSCGNSTRACLASLCLDSSAPFTILCYSHMYPALKRNCTDKYKVKIRNYQYMYSYTVYVYVVNYAPTCSSSYFFNSLSKTCFTGEELLQAHWDLWPQFSLNVSYSFD